MLSDQQMWAKLREQAAGPKDCKGGTEILTWDDLILLIQHHLGEFLSLCRDEVDLATWAAELLEYCNGPRPEIEIVPQGDEKMPKFRVTLDPEQEHR